MFLAMWSQQHMVPRPFMEACQPNVSTTFGIRIINNNFIDQLLFNNREDTHDFPITCNESLSHLHFLCENYLPKIALHCSLRLSAEKNTIIERYHIFPQGGWGGGGMFSNWRPNKGGEVRIQESYFYFLLKCVLCVKKFYFERKKLFRLTIYNFSISFFFIEILKFV